MTDEREKKASVSDTKDLSMGESESVMLNGRETVWFSI